MTYIVRNDELYHHGILGQKWGIRRYQNPDGSLTAEGKKRYLTDVKFKYKYDKYAKKQELKRIDKLMKKSTRKLTDDELRERISRKQLESSAEIAPPKPQQNVNYQNNSNNQPNKGSKGSDGIVKKIIGGVANTAINQATKNAGSIIAAKIVKSLFNKKDDKEKKDQDNNEKKPKTDEEVLLEWLNGGKDKKVKGKYMYELKPSDISTGKDAVTDILSNIGDLSLTSISSNSWQSMSSPKTPKWDYDLLLNAPNTNNSSTKSRDWGKKSKNIYDSLVNNDWESIPSSSPKTPKYDSSKDDFLENYNKSTFGSVGNSVKSIMSSNIPKYSDVLKSVSSSLSSYGNTKVSDISNLSSAISSIDTKGYVSKVLNGRDANMLVSEISSSNISRNSDVLKWR